MATSAYAFYSLHRTFDWKVRNFPDSVYNFGPNDHLTRLMTTLLEDPGVGQLRKIQTAARLAQKLGGTRYSDLDFFYGGLLSFNRLPEEQYAYNPFVDQLTSAQWDEVTNKDASYRSRISKLLQSMNQGGTKRGLQLAAEGASGYPCQVLEVWRAIDFLGLPTTPGRMPSTAVNKPYREFVVVPKLVTGEVLDNGRKLAIYRAIQQLKPANAICTVNELGLEIHMPVTIRQVSADSEYFEVQKTVTGVNVPPDPGSNVNFWLQDNVPVTAPTFAHMSGQEAQMSLNESVTSITSFTLDSTTQQYTILPSNVDVDQRTWGPWRAIETADSPDNYIDGKYSGDPAKYNASGQYIYSWASQEAYLDWLTEFVGAVGGELAYDRYRFPATVEAVPSALTSTDDALAPTSVSVQTLYYGQG